jgi:heme exporter protein D
VIGEFFAMGGYGAFVWPAYATAASVLVLLLATSLRRLRRVRRALELREKGKKR